MSARRPWPPAEMRAGPLPWPVPGRTRMGGPRVLILLHHDATPAERVDAARELLDGTPYCVTPAPWSPSR